MSLEAREIKAKMNYRNPIKIKSFCTAKKTFNKTKRQPTEWEMFANDILDEKINTQNLWRTYQTQHPKPNNPVKKWAEDTNRHFSKEDIQMVNRHMKRCSTLLIIREKQIKCTLRYHFTHVRMAKINNLGNNRCWRGCGETGTLLHCWWECKLVQPLWKQYGGSSKN